MSTSQLAPVSPSAATPLQVRGLELLNALWSYTRDPLATVEHYARRYGDVVYVPRAKTFLLSHPEHIEQVLKETGKTFRKGYIGQDPVSDFVFGNGLVSSEGDFWRRQRRVVQPAFHRRRIAAYGATMREHTERLLARWQPGTTRELHADMGRLTLEIVVHCLFGADIGSKAARFVTAFEQVLAYSRRRSSSLLQFVPWLPDRGRAGFAAAAMEIERFLAELIARDDHGNRDDMLAMLLAARDDDGEPMSSRQLRDEVLTMLVAGHDTTANTLTWAFYLLDRHPHIRRTLLAELDSVLGGRVPEAEDLASLPYAGAVVNETMRLYPAVDNVSRVAVGDTELGGYAIPSGSTVVLSQWVVHHDARWFPEPQSFKPERWLGGGERQIPRYAFFPFGGGPRLCIGNNFALLEATIVLAAVLQRFELTLVPGHPIAIDPTAMHPRHGMPMTVSRRS